MTDEDIEKLIDKKITEFALKLPHVISNLVMEASKKVKMWNKFIEDNPYLKNVHAELVGKIVMEVDEKNPGKPYDYILKEAEPILRERLKILSSVDINNPTKKPDDLTFKGNLGEL